MSPAIAIYSISTGDVVVLAAADAPLRPGQASVALPGDYDEEIYEWSRATRTMIPSLAKVEAALIAVIKQEAERRKMKLMSPGGAKKAEYAEKRAEVNFWDTLGGSLSAILVAFNLMPAAQRQTKFAWALADAAAFGDTVDKAIGRFRAGMASSASVTTIAAVEARACAAIKSATTVSAKRAAAVVAWPNQ